MKPSKILLKDVNNAGALYSRAINTWGKNNQITIRAEIKWHELKKKYNEQQTFKSRKKS